MNTQALLAEILLSGFFAVACLRARAESPSMEGLAPQTLRAHGEIGTSAPITMAMVLHGAASDPYANANGCSACG